MTESNESDVRAALQAWARDVQPSAGDPTALMTEARAIEQPPRPNVVRPVLWAAGAAAAGILAVGLITTADQGPDTWGSTSETVDGTQPPGSTIPVYTEPTTTRPAGPLAGFAVPVVFHSADPGWTGAGVWVNRGRFTAIGLRHADGRRVGLQLSEPAADSAPSALTGDTLAPDLVRGHPASVGQGALGNSTVLSWEEAGHHWLLQTVPGSAPFASTADFVAFAENFEVVDQATFEAWLPPDMLAALYANPEAGGVNWEEGKPPQVSP